MLTNRNLTIYTDSQYDGLSLIENNGVLIKEYLEKLKFDKKKTKNDTGCRRIVRQR